MTFENQNKDAVFANPNVTEQPVPDLLRTARSREIYLSLNARMWPKVKKLFWPHNQVLTVSDLIDCFQVAVVRNDIEMLQDVLQMGINLQNHIRMGISQSIALGYPQVFETLLKAEIAQEGRIIGNLSVLVHEICMRPPNPEKISFLKIIYNLTPEYNGNMLRELCDRGDVKTFNEIFKETGHSLSPAAAFNIACSAVFLSTESLRLVKSMDYDFSQNLFLVQVSSQPFISEKQLLEVLQCFHDVNFQEKDRLQALTILMAGGCVEAFTLINKDEKITNKQMFAYLKSAIKEEQKESVKFLLSRVDDNRCIERILRSNSLTITNEIKSLLIDQVLRQGANKSMNKELMKGSLNKTVSKKTSFRL